MYDLEKVAVYKRQLAIMAVAMYDGKPLDGPLQVELGFYRHLQTSITKKERKLRLSGAHRPTMKPDVDNYIKSTLDGLNGILWQDDNQIVDISAHKFYSDRPRVEIEVKKFCSIHKQ